jgi:glyoxalase family protein
LKSHGKSKCLAQSCALIKEANMPGILRGTAIAGDPLKNLSFYTRDLGLRFVKKTVHFDDPSTYHFYYGDETGRPGTILTFFSWTNVSAGRRGAGETRQTAFRVPLRSIGYWTERFIEKRMRLRAGAREGSASAPSPARR